MLRAALSPRAEFLRRHDVVGSLTTIENEVKLDPFAHRRGGKPPRTLWVWMPPGRQSLFAGLRHGTGARSRAPPDLEYERDALGMPRLNLHMTISDDDFLHFRQTLAELGRQLLAAKSGMIHLSYSQRHEWLAAMDWGNHHLGTTRMSADPRQGVVDADSKVHGIANLYVAGSSVFPTYGSSNPTLNLVALTLRLADHLKKVMA